MKIPVLSLDKPNKNGRIYPRDVIEKALQKYRDEYVSKSRAMVTRNIPTQNDPPFGQGMNQTAAKTDGDEGEEDQG